MSNKIQFENSMQQTNCYENLYENPLELALRRNPQSVDYALKLIDIYPVYCLEGKKHICYRKELKEEQKLLIIQNHINSPTYEWKGDVYINTISLYHFMSIRKNQEWIVSYALRKGIENNYIWWEIWGVLEDGTILSPRETRKITKLLQVTTVEPDFNIDENEEDWDEKKAREYYNDHFAEGASDVWQKYRK